MNAQDRMFSPIEDILFAYYRRRFPNKKTVEVTEITKPLFDSGIVQVGNITVFDMKYKCVDENTWNEVIDLFWARRIKWQEEWDCDKFAIAFKCLCNELGITSVGIVIGDLNGSHAFNCYVNSDSEVFIVEPQTGDRVKVVKGQPIIINGGTYTIAKIII